MIGGQHAGPDRRPQGIPNARLLEGALEPLQAETRDRPGLVGARVEGVDPDDHQRQVDERQDARSWPSSRSDARGARSRSPQSASKAPSRRATARYTTITTTGIRARAAASGRLPGHPHLAVDDVAQELRARDQRRRDEVAHRQREREDGAGHDGRERQGQDHLAEGEAGPATKVRGGLQQRVGIRSSPATMGRIMYGSHR